MTVIGDGTVVPDALTGVDLQYGAFAICLALVVLIAWLVVQFMRELRSTRDTIKVVTDHCQQSQDDTRKHSTDNFASIESAINRNTEVIGRCTGILEKVEHRLEEQETREATGR